MKIANLAQENPTAATAFLKLSNADTAREIQDVLEWLEEEQTLLTQLS